jgi:uncharacterized membrane protein YdjX (TVP38/TMEM64 family)
MTSERHHVHVSSNALQVFVALSIVGVLLEILASILATGFVTYILLATGAAIFGSALTFFLVKTFRH